MLLPAFLSASALALTANAFLLPLEVTTDQTSPFDPTSFAQQSQTINLDCSTCPLAVGKDQDGTVWKQGIQNNLVMEFTAEDNSLKLNGVPFYPVAMPPLPPAISAKQVRKDGEEDPSTNVEPVRLSYSLEFEKEKATKGPQDPVLVEALMTVMGLEGQMVRVDNIEIKAFKSPNGELKLLSVSSQTPSPDAPDAKCTNIMCRVFTKIAAKLHKAGKKMKHVCMKCLQRLQALKNHGGRPNMPSVPDMPAVPAVPETVKLPTHHHFQIGHHGHHGWAHKLAHKCKKIFAFVVLPILIGGAFGLAAAAVGMLVGQIVVSLWLRRRRNDVQYQAVETDDGEQGLPKYEELDGVSAGDEKERLVEKI